MAREIRSEFTANVQLSTAKQVPAWAQPSKRVARGITPNKSFVQKLVDKLTRKD